MKKVAILSTFTDVDLAYSLISVVETQLRMLVFGGYKPVMIVKAGFRPEEAFALPEVELRYIPHHHSGNSVIENFDAEFETDVEKLKLALKEDLKDIDVVLTHDLIYQPESIKLNYACRKLIQEDDHARNIRWLHWVHSATSPEVLGKELSAGQKYDGYIDLVKTRFPNSFVVFPNDYSRPRVARNFGFEEDQIKRVYHPTNIAKFNAWDPLVTQMVMEKGMLQHDAMAIYPVRLDRGKQVEVVIKIMAELKKLAFNVRVVVCDFHSTGGDKVTYREDLKKMAKEWGLNDNDLTFTSEFHETWHYRVPPKVISDLLDLSNVFIMPSKSETYSLVTQEAAFKKNLLVLNHDFAPFREIYGPMAIYKQFSANIGMDGLDGDIQTSYQTLTGEGGEAGEHAFFHDVAMRIKYEILNNFVLATERTLRKDRNPVSVFKNMIEPLFYEK